MLLIVTNKSDLTSDYLLLRAEERGWPVFRFNTEDLGREFEIELSIADRPGFVLESRTRSLSDADVEAVYLRQPRRPDASGDVARSDVAFARRELNEVLRSLWRVIDKDLWLNHPTALWSASNKIDQLSVAKSMGWQVPPTIVTSSAETVRRFRALHPGGVVCKAVKHGFFQGEDAVTLAMTRRLTDEDLARFDTYAAVPAIYQREILKTYDVRVTVVGEHLVAVAIHSQDRTETEVDWRRWDVAAYELRHEIITLPPRIAELCFAMTRHYGLRYAAIDLVLDRRDGFYFLELNPNGQWAWIEQKTGFPVRDAILDTLAHGRS